MKTRWISRGHLTAVLAGVAWLAGGLAWAADPIKIGVALPYTGDLASYGIPARDAAKLAVKEINEKGGVLGRSLELVIEDDVCQPNIATSVANKLVGEKVVAVLGHLCSGATEAALGVYRPANIPVISPASTNPDLTFNGKNPHFFRTIAHDAAQATLQVEFALNTLKIKKAAVLHDKGTYGKGLATLVKEGLEKAKVDVALFEGVTPGAVDYSAIVRKIQRAEVDAVLFGGYHPEASKLVAQARAKKITVPFISGDGVKDPTFLKIAGEFAEGYYASAPVDVSQVKLAQDVTAAYKKDYNADPGTFSFQSYAAIQALANAMQKSGDTAFEGVAKMLRAEEVETPLGKIHFDERGDVVGTGFALYQVQKGEFTRVK